MLEPVRRRRKLVRRFLFVAFSSLVIILGSVNLWWFLLLPGNFAVPRSARWLERILITEASCEDCQGTSSLQGRWTCECGFTMPTYQHIFAPCTNCSRAMCFYACPACESSIEV